MFAHNHSRRKLNKQMFVHKKNYDHPAKKKYEAYRHKESDNHSYLFRLILTYVKYIGYNIK